RLGGRERQFHGRGRRRTRIQVAREKRYGNNGVPTDRDAANRWRHRLPPAQRRTHARPELADLHHVREPVSEGFADPLTRYSRRSAAVGSIRDDRYVTR